MANDYSTLPLGGALRPTLGNPIQGVLAAWLIQRLLRRGSPLDSTGGVVGLTAATAIGTGASALIGPLSLVASGPLSLSAFPAVARTWWLGDACGVLLVVPLALAWFGPPPERREQMRAWNAVTVVIVTSGLVWASMLTEDRVAYLVFPALLYAAIRCGSRVASAAVAVSAAAAVWATTHYVGPFVFHSINNS